MLSRAFGAWVLMMGLETIHGTLRTLFLTPRVGDLPARQISFFTGSVLILLVATLCARWIGASTRRSQLQVGLLWVLLTLGFELVLGRLIGRSWAEIAGDFNLLRGGLMGLGLLLLLFAPTIGWRLRGARPAGA
jgi:hypothetical protein